MAADLDPVTGPLTREQIRELAQAPFGTARAEIQKHDPFWGLTEGEKIEFEVICKGRIEGRAYIKATSQEEADGLAYDLTEAEIDWDFGGASDDFNINSIKPRKRGRA